MALKQSKGATNERPDTIPNHVVGLKNQKYERVFSDHLFRVRTRQPNLSESHANVPKTSDANILPARCETIQVGDVCVFKNTNNSERKKGKVLQFFTIMVKSAKDGNTNCHHCMWTTAKIFL